MLSLLPGRPVPRARSHRRALAIRLAAAVMMSITASEVGAQATAAEWIPLFDDNNPLSSAGANAALHAAPRGVVQAAGKWNSARLVVNRTHVEHWLNSTKMAEYDLGAADWEARRKASKFATAEKYGRATRGQIALQDHGDRVYFRNVRIRELP